MKAVFHTGVPVPWGNALGDRPWCLAPVGGKPLLEYWLEWAAEWNTESVHLVLGDGADEVEALVGDGSRWGLKTEYGFQKNMADPDAYLSRSPGRWSPGLLYLRGPVFPRRLQPPPLPAPGTDRTWVWRDEDCARAFFSLNAVHIQKFLSGSSIEASGSWTDLGLEPAALRTVKAYFDLNMRMVGGESRLYVPQGYWNRDGASIGSNVLIPPSADVRPPLAIGNDCRIHPMAVIGPNAVIGNHVIVDRQTELSHCIVLDGTYLGRNLEIQDKIVSGDRVVSPEDGSVVKISEPWLLAELAATSRLRDGLRAVAGGLLAIGLLLVQAIPFALLYPWLRQRKIGGYSRSHRLGPGGRRILLPVWETQTPALLPVRIFTGLGLDLFPLIIRAATGRLWLCGHAPLHPERDADLVRALRRYFPAAIGYHTRREASPGDRAASTVEALYYERYRSWTEDVRTVFRALSGRFLDAVFRESDTRSGPT